MDHIARSNHPDSLLVLGSLPRVLRAKTAVFDSNGNWLRKIDPLNSMMHDRALLDVSTQGELFEAVKWLSDPDNAGAGFPIRGGLSKLAPADPDTEMYRRYKDTRDPTTNHLQDVRRSFGNLDLDLDDDKVAHLVGSDWLDYPEAVAADVIAELFPMLKDVGWIAAFSASQRPQGGRFRAHLWLRLSKPLSCREWLWWARNAGLMNNLDRSGFVPAQPIYGCTVCVNEDGERIDDPLGEARVTMRKGPALNVDHVPELEMSETEQHIVEWNEKSANAKAAREAGLASPLTQMDVIEAFERCLYWIKDTEYGGKGLRDGLRALALYYAYMTGGQDRRNGTPPDWMMEMLDRAVTEYVNSGEITGLGQEHRDLRLGRKSRDFIDHYRGALARADHDDPSVWGRRRASYDELMKELEVRARRRAPETPRKTMAEVFDDPNPLDY